MKKKPKVNERSPGDMAGPSRANPVKAKRSAGRQGRTITIVSERSRRRLSKPPKNSLERLIEAATRDLTTARLTLGLICSITRVEMDPLFPGYSWSVSDVLDFEAALIPDARRVLQWALGSTHLILDDLILGQRRICEGAYSIRARSPIGRQFRRRVLQFKKAYPPLPQAEWTFNLPGKSLEGVELLPKWIGQPLSSRIIALVRAIHPGRQQIVEESGPIAGVWTPGVASIRLAADGYSVKSITLGVALEARNRDMPVRRFEGQLREFFETGTEGLVWSIYDDHYNWHDGLEWIKEGDDLTILDQLGNLIWRGVIECDRKTGWERYPRNPAYGQQCALGYWVHWVQKGFKPDDWARFFIRPSFDRLRGVLVRKTAPSRRARERKNREAAFEVIDANPGLVTPVHGDPKGA